MTFEALVEVRKDFKHVSERMQNDLIYVLQTP